MGADLIEHATGEFSQAVFVKNPPTGTVYEHEYTAADDNAHALSGTTLLLRDVVVLVSTNDALFGDENNQRFPRAAAASFGLVYMDLSTLYVKNATAGNNTKVNVLGTKVV